MEADCADLGASARSLVMLACCSVKRTRRQQHRVLAIVGTPQKLPLQSHIFDVVLSFGTVEHLSDPSAYLHEVHRVLNENGLLLISVPAAPVYYGVIALLRAVFPFVTVLEQRHVLGIMPGGNTERETAVLDVAETPPEALGFVCICSTTHQNLPRDMFFRALPEQQGDSCVAAEKGSFRGAIESQAKWIDNLGAELSKTQADYAQVRAQLQQHQSLLANSTRWKRMLMCAALLPADWIVGGTIIATELAGRLLRIFKRVPLPVLVPPDRGRVSIVIVSWEGKELLAESLPPLVRALEVEGGHNHEVIVVDNGSTDGTEEYLRNNFPEVRVVRSETNLYFGGGNNLGIRQASNDIVVLLNNDMIVAEDFLAPLVEPFESPKVFAVGSQVFLADERKRREETGKTAISFNGLDLDWMHESIFPDDAERRYIPVLWGHGGAVAMHRQKFLRLGGFDSLYDPFYVEDADVSYVAWKMGWQTLLAIRSRVVHKHRSSTRRFGETFIAQIVRRNQLLFLWKNFSDLRILFTHFARSWRMHTRRAGQPGVGVRTEAVAFLGAAKRLLPIIRRKLWIARSATRTDREILEMTTNLSSQAIRSSLINFATGSYSEYLGEGWHELHSSAGESYRWISTSASLFLRTPSDRPELVIRGFIPPLVHYGHQKPILTVRCFGQQKSFLLREGAFEHCWQLEVPPDRPVEIRLCTNRALQASDSDIPLAIVIYSVALRRTDRQPQSSERPAITVSNKAGVNRPESTRILMVCPYLPMRGSHGGANLMFNLIRSLSNRYGLTVLSFYENEAELQYVPELSKYCDALEVIYRGQTFDEGNLFGVKPSNIVYEFHHSRMAQLVRRYLAAKKFDILHCEFLYTAHLAALNPDIPAVLTNHEVLSLSYENNYRRLHWFQRGKLKALVAWMRTLNYEEKVLRRMSAVVVLTPSEAEFLERLNPRIPVYARAMGVDCEYFFPQRKPDTKTVVFVGNFRHSPNVSAALWLLREIWPRVHSEVPDARLFIVGGEPDVRMQKFDGNDNVVLTGWVEDVRPYLNQATVVVAPVFEGAGMRTKVLEAWAMQKPVVGTSLAFKGLSTQSGELGYVAEQTEEFVRYVVLLLNNPESAHSMGERARRFVQESFSWDAFAETYDHIYSEILQKRKGQKEVSVNGATEMLSES